MNNLELIGCLIFKNGSGIHIKKKNRGKFTASAKRAGLSAQEYARSILNKPDRSILDNGWIPTNKLKKGTYGLIKKHRGGDKLDTPPSRNWDNTLVGRLINYAENKDSIGFDKKLLRWYAPSKDGYDKNQFGMGVDRNKTEGFKKLVKRNKYGKEYLTVLDERFLRHKKIDLANESANLRYRHAQQATGNLKGAISPVNDALTISAIYNLGLGHVANTIFENKNAMGALFKRDFSYMPYVHSEYKKKKRNERIRSENEFLKSER